MARILQFNIEDPYGLYVEELSPEDIVELASSINADTLVIFARDGWGRVFYRSGFYPLHPKVSEDFLEKIYRLCKERGIRLVPMVCHTSNKFIAERRPEWVQRNARGEVIALDTERVDGLNWPLACLNSGFLDLCLEEVREVRDFSDAIMLDSFRYQPDFNLACACNKCKEIFRRRYGLELPSREDWDDAAWWRAWFWRYEVVIEALRKVKGECNGKPLVYNSHPAGWGWRANTVVERARDLIDVVFAECSEADFQPPGFLLEMAKLSKGLSRRDVWVTRNTFHLFNTPYLLNEKALELGVWEIVSAGASPMFLVFASSYWQNMDRLKMLRKIFEKVEMVEEALEGAEPLEEVGIVYSNLTRDYLGRGDPESYNEEVRGFFHALLNMHFQPGFLGESDINRAELGRYRAIILPNKAVMSAKEVEELVRYVEDGGRVIATYLTSLYDHSYQRGDFLLAESFGSSFYGVRKGLWLYYEDMLIGDYEEGIGSYAVTRPRKGARIIGKVFEGIFKAGYEYALGRAPPPKGKEVSYATEGRMAYLPFQLGRALFKYGYPEYYDLLRRLLRIDPLIRVQGPETLRAIAWRKDNSLLIHLLNETVNQRITMSHPLTAKFLHRMGVAVNPVREVVPISNVKVSVKGRFSKARLLLSRKEARAVSKNGRTEVVVDRIDLYDLLILE